MKTVCVNTYEIVYEVNNLLFVRFLLGNALVEYNSFLRKRTRTGRLSYTA